MLRAVHANWLTYIHSAALALGSTLVVSMSTSPKTWGCRLTLLCHCFVCNLAFVLYCTVCGRPCRLPDAFAAAVRAMSPSELRAARPQSLANMAWALATWGRCDTMALDCLAEAMLHLVGVWGDASGRGLCGGRRTPPCVDGLREGGVWGSRNYTFHTSRSTRWVLRTCP